MKALATNPEDICTGNAGCHTFSYEGVSNFGHEIMAINFAVVMPSHIKALATIGWWWVIGIMLLSYLLI